jgi:hypothetical protein
MAAPSAALVTLRPDLAASFEQFDLAMSWNGFIGSKVLPMVDVLSQAGNFGIIPIEQLLQARTTARAPGAAYPRALFTFKPSTYACKENGFEEPIDDREVAMYQNYLAAEQYAALRARDAVLRNYETRVINLLTDTSVFTGALTSAVAVSWKTVASSTPTVDIITAVKAVYANSGIKPNTVVMGWSAWQNFRQSADTVNRIKYWGGNDPSTKGITTQVAANLFDVEDVIVAGAQKNNANEGASASLTQLWNDDRIQVCRVARTNDFKEPAIGRSFHWGADGSTPTGTVESYRDERVRGNVIRVRMDTDEQVIYKQLGYLLTGANA